LQIISKSPKINASKVIKILESLPDYHRSSSSKFEDDCIRKYYPSKGSAIAEALGKTPTQIRRRACVLKIRRMTSCYDTTTL